MAQSFYSKFTLIFTLVVGAGTAHADSGNGFFGVGLSVLASKPTVPVGVIYRNAVYTPGAVAIGLSAQGYTQVGLVSRGVNGYVFSAVLRANGQRFLLTVAAWRGEIVSAVRG